MFRTPLLFVAILLMNVLVAQCNIIGIDFASDSIKVAIVQPSTPLEIVSNFQSKRKTPAAVSFYRGERIFGSDATALQGRKPELTFSNIYRMIGRSIYHPIIQEFEKQYFPYQFYSNETTGSTSLQLLGAHYTPEELMALLLQHVQEMSEAFGGKSVKDCVITVPSFFTHHERDAVYTAASIAELNVLSLVEENIAAAVHYTLDRTFDTPYNLMFFNMGAGSVQVSVVQFTSHIVKEAGRNKTIGSFQVLGKAWDSSLGGFNFDVRLAEVLADRFNLIWESKTSGKEKNLRNFPQPMTKLRIQANKVKEILSANTEFPVKIEQLHADIDLNTKVTRAEFENACEDLYARVTVPIDAALTMANLTVSQLHNVELLGGGVRMPRIKKILEGYFVDAGVGVGQHLNGDEAMAMGAAFRAANLSTAFRVRKEVVMTDISSFGVSVRLNSISSSDNNSDASREVDDEVWTKFTNLYPAGSTVPSKMKTVAFKFSHDISCRLEYDVTSLTSLPNGTNPLISVYKITGISAFNKEHAEKNIGPSKVHLSFILDSSGLVSVVKAEATLDLSLLDNIAVASPNTEGESTIEGSVDLNDSESSNSVISESSDTSSAAKENKNIIIERERFIRQNLMVEIAHSATHPPKWTPAQIAEARAKRHALKIADDLKKATEAAFNDLEGFIYSVKNEIVEKEGVLSAVSTKEQRQNVLELADATEEWLYDEGRGQTITVYKSRQQDILNAANAIFHRLAELTARQNAISQANNLLKTVFTALAEWQETLPHSNLEEREELETTAASAKKWIAEKVALQENTSPFDAPSYESVEVTKHLKSVKALFEKLLSKPKAKISAETNEETKQSMPISSEESSETNDSNPGDLPTQTEKDL